MTIDQLIDKLNVFKENLEDGGNTPLLIVEHGFAQNAVQSYVRLLEDYDIAFEQDLQLKDLVYPEPGLESGLVIGIVPKYVTENS